MGTGISAFPNLKSGNEIMNGTYLCLSIYSSEGCKQHSGDVNPSIKYVRICMGQTHNSHLMNQGKGCAALNPNESFI